MVDEQTGRVVDKDHKGRGYELSKGRYVEIEDEELDAVKLDSTHTIEIDDFVPAEDIDERYLDKPYIVPNGKAGADAFVVIRDAMKRKDKVALARVVLSSREHVIALKPLGKGLLGTTLRYPYELRPQRTASISAKRRNESHVTIEAMEARSVEVIPAGEAWQYEPKWDGFRCLLTRRWRPDKGGSVHNEAGQTESGAPADQLRSLSKQ
jgi:Ku protein